MKQKIVEFQLPKGFATFFIELKDGNAFVVQQTIVDGKKSDYMIVGRFPTVADCKIAIKSIGNVIQGWRIEGAL